MDDILKHYDQVREADRLARGSGPLELARTQEILRRHLPPAPAVILDVGGGPGVYSCWLASQGYQVNLIEPVSRHLAEAEEAARRAGVRLASIRQGDAQRLECADASADAVLLLGPLYHLTTTGERRTALREVRRVLRRGGWLFAAAISRYASLVDGLLRGFLTDPDFARIVERDLAEGQHRNPTGDPNFFTTAFFHHPQELRDEVTEAGFDSVAVLAVEGPGWLARDFERHWQDSAWRTRLLDALRHLEREPSLLGVSAHVLAVARNL